MKPLQMWGGLECTLNRIGDRYVDQCEKNGHYKRLSDLELFHDLGIKKLRYPCLWEKVAPTTLDHCDWKYLDERLNELKRLGQDFIAGFLHHGSGPRYTSLIDPEFPEKLATYARLFAIRYPWVTDYTPINEINTTARFSLLYGHWYPHLSDSCQYYRSMFLQCKATVLAMREIKRVNPKARLIQTDDLGKCQSTDVLAYQSDHENERRWLTWDLLSGRISMGHPMYEDLLKYGVSQDEIEWFQENTCAPDIIGINHYLLSNRYLDHRLELFPEWSHGGNGIHRYADVGAVDTGLVELIDIEELLRETWTRYGKPIAITECHTRGRRESQMRWLQKVWQTCLKLRDENIPIEAVTAWSLLGTYDWHNLCTNCEFFYEAGVFDLRNPSRIPEATALSKMVSDLARTGEHESPILSAEGVWQTGRRILYNAKFGQFTSLEWKNGTRPVLIVGSRGTLGQALSRICGARNIHARAIGRPELDITDKKSIMRVIDEINPWAVINAAGYVRVDEAEDEQDECFRQNVEGALNLARICRENGIKLVSFSSDLVFGIAERKKLTETHPVSPLSTYGKSKAECERKVLAEYPESLVIRTSSFFGPWDDYNFVTKVLRSLASRMPVEAASDIYVSPTYVPDLANETLDLLIDGVSGIIHLTNVGEVTWAELAIMTAEKATMLKNLNTELIKEVKITDLSFLGQRPRYSVLTSERQTRLPTLSDAFKRYFEELQVPIFDQQEMHP